MNRGVGFHRLLPDLGAVVAGVVVILAALAMAGPGSDPGPQIKPACGPTLQVSSSTERGKSSIGSVGSGVLQRAAQEFNALQVAKEHCAQVVVTGLTSGRAELELEKAKEFAKDGAAGAGTPFRPDAWTPTDSLWARLLEHRTGQRLTYLGSLAASPMVVAVAPQTASRLGWEGSPPAWPDLRDRIKDGTLRLLKENPTFSTSGAAATLLAYRAGLPGTVSAAKLTVEDTKDGIAQQFAADIEQGVVTYPDDIIEILDETAQAGTRTRPGELPAQAECRRGVRRDLHSAGRRALVRFTVSSGYSD